MRHIHPLEPIAVIILIAVLWYMRRQQKPPAPKPLGQGAKPGVIARPVKEEKPPEEVYMGLRKEAFQVIPAGLVVGDEPYGALMELGLSTSVVTLVCFANGDASVYYKTGGGMIGGLSHDPVCKAAKEFVDLAEKALPRMTATTEQPLPEADRVRFYLLSPKGIFTAETDREGLGEDPGNELSALYYKGQEVVTQMRQVQEQKAR